MSIRIDAPRLAATALLSFALGACGDDGAASDSTGESSSGGSTTSTGVADSGSDSSGGMALPGYCMRFPTIPSIGYVFVAEGTEPGACDGKPAPCVGDPFGEWTLAAACGAVAEVPVNPFGEACPGANYVPDVPASTGALSVDPSGTFSLSATTTFSFLFEADITCLGVFECGPEAESVITRVVGGSAACTGEVNACSCMVTEVPLESASIAGDGASAERSLLLRDDDTILPVCAADGQITAWSLLAAPMYAGTGCTVDDDCEAENDNQIAACIYY